tara:strand:- start:50 stop:169 length:120 start_codon:yes stop_codon:yes gene_type:complete
MIEKKKRTKRWLVSEFRITPPHKDERNNAINNGKDNRCV